MDIKGKSVEENKAIFNSFLRNFGGNEKLEAVVKNEISQFGTNDAQEFFSQKEYKIIDENLKEKNTSTASRHLMVITQDIEGAISFIEESLNR